MSKLNNCEIKYQAYLQDHRVKDGLASNFIKKVIMQQVFSLQFV